MQQQVKRESGVVLITTLLILMILALITNFYMRQARHQVQLAFGLQQKAAACEQAQRVFHSVTSKLLTSVRTQLSGQPASSISQNISDQGFWNFYNHPFDYDSNTVYIQDLAGLVPLDNLNGSLGAKFLMSQGITDSELRGFVNSLRDWEDRDDLHRLEGAEANYYAEKGLPLPRNNLVTSIYETRLIKGYPDILDSIIENGYITTLPQPYFNPLNAPTPVLASYLNSADLAERISERRRIAPLKGVEFSSLTGLSESPYVLFAPSTGLRVKVIGASQHARCTEEWIVNLKGNVRDSYTLRAVY